MRSSVPSTRRCTDITLGKYGASQCHDGPVSIPAGLVTWGQHILSPASLPCSDGARAFKDVMPDVDRHCARANDSAVVFGLKPAFTNKELVQPSREKLLLFEADAAVCCSDAGRPLADWR